MKFVLAFLFFACFLLRSTLLAPDCVDTKSTKSPAVAYFNVWTIGWNADRLKHGLSGYWDSPIFYPEANTFALSEPQPATLLVAPLVWASGSPILAYKMWLLICLVANGFFAVLLARRLKFHVASQWVAGFAMILLPMSQQRIDVIQLVPVWGILWFFSCLFELSQKATLKRGIECGVSFAACFYLCLHHSLFLSLLMPFSCLVFVPLFRNRGFAISAVCAAVVATVCVVPVVLPVMEATADHAFTRSPDLVSRLSAYPSQYLASQKNAWLDPLNWFDGWKPDASLSRRFHIGWGRMLFAVIAIAFAFRNRTHRRWTVFLLLTALAAFAFSLGPHLNLGSWVPWSTVQEYVPGFKQVRNVFRFAWFVQIAAVLLAIQGFDILVQRSVQLKHVERLTWKRVLATAGLGLLLAFEVWPEPSIQHYAPAARKHKKWVNFLREQCPPGQPVVCLPMAFGNRLKDLEIETRWMLLSLGHGIPMVNGYSGFFPAHYNQLVGVVNRAGASDELLNELMRRQVGLIVVARGFPITNKIRTFQSDQFEMQHLFADEIGVDIYAYRLKSE